MNWKILRESDTVYIVYDRYLDAKGSIVQQAIGHRWKVVFNGLPAFTKEWPTCIEACAYVRGVEQATAVYGKEVTA